MRLFSNGGFYLLLYSRPRGIEPANAVNGLLPFCSLCRNSRSPITRRMRAQCARRIDRPQLDRDPISPASRCHFQASGIAIDRRRAD
jgi:hypothetical protein